MNGSSVVDISEEKCMSVYAVEIDGKIRIVTKVFNGIDSYAYACDYNMALASANREQFEKLASKGKK